MKKRKEHIPLSASVIKQTFILNSQLRRMEMDQKQLEIYDGATSLLAKLDSSFLELGRILRVAQNEDKTLFKSLMALPGLERRTAYYLITISRTFDPLPVDQKCSPSALVRQS